MFKNKRTIFLNGFFCMDVQKKIRENRVYLVLILQGYFNELLPELNVGIFQEILLENT